jgi:hypothetical protein
VYTESEETRPMDEIRPTTFYAAADAEADGAFCWRVR